MINLKNLPKLVIIKSNLTSLKDIKYLTNLTILECSQNQLNSLDKIKKLIVKKIKLSV